MIQSLYNPQTLNRYTYCVNNPLTFNDPSGQDYISEHGGGTINNVPIVDKIVPIVPTSFIITSGLVPYDNAWTPYFNSLAAMAYFLGSGAMIKDSGLSQSDYPSTVDITGNVTAYHTSSGLNGVSCGISSSASIGYNVTLNWTYENGNTGRASMDPIRPDDGMSIAPYPYNSSYGVSSYNTVASFPSPSQSPFGAQAILTFIVSEVPNYNDKAVKSMCVTIVPNASQSSDPSAAYSYTRPEIPPIYLKGGQ